MLKRKYGSRYEWQRVTKREYAQMKMVTDSFDGYISLLHLKEVRDQLWVSYKGKSICVADNGYYWMQHFPEGEHYSVSTMFDSSGRIVQWYIDICNKIGYCAEKGPWMDDLFLDLIVLPSGEIIRKRYRRIRVCQSRK